MGGISNECKLIFMSEAAKMNGNKHLPGREKILWYASEAVE